jgi:hypothetical protein
VHVALDRRSASEPSEAAKPGRKAERRQHTRVSPKKIRSRRYRTLS